MVRSRSSFDHTHTVKKNHATVVVVVASRQWVKHRWDALAPAERERLEANAALDAARYKRERAARDGWERQRDATEAQV